MLDFAYYLSHDEKSHSVYVLSMKLGRYWTLQIIFHLLNAPSCGLISNAMPRYGQMLRIWSYSLIYLIHDIYYVYIQCVAFVLTARTGKSSNKWIHPRGFLQNRTSRGWLDPSVGCRTSRTCRSCISMECATRNDASWNVYIYTYTDVCTYIYIYMYIMCIHIYIYM